MLICGPMRANCFVTLKLYINLNFFSQVSNNCGSKLKINGPGSFSFFAESPGGARLSYKTRRRPLSTSDKPGKNLIIFILWKKKSSQPNKDLSQRKKGGFITAWRLQRQYPKGLLNFSKASCEKDILVHSKPI